MCGPDYLRTKLGDAPLARARANNLIFKFLAGKAPREIFDEYGGGWGRKTTVATEGFKSQAREAIARPDQPREFRPRAGETAQSDEGRNPSRN